MYLFPLKMSAIIVFHRNLLHRGYGETVVRVKHPLLILKGPGLLKSTIVKTHNIALVFTQLYGLFFLAEVKEGLQKPT